MKKLIIMATILVAGVIANAASFKWTGANVYGPDGNKLASATAYLFCDALSAEAITSTTIANGTFAAKTFDVSATAGTAYNFYYVVTTTYDSKEYTFTSSAATATASDTGTANLPFGNQQSATTAAGAWTTAAVPEPTSGLLMLLGMAGLALRRRRA